MALILEKEITQEATIPNGWIETTLENIVLSTRLKIQPSKASTLPFIGMDSIEPNSLVVSSVGKFSDMKSSGVYFMPGDVLYGKMRPYLNKVYKADFEGACSAEFLVFPKHNNLDSDFLKYLLHQRDFVNFASPKSSGDRPRIDFTDIADYQVLLPPFNEQKRIVSKIEELFSQLDDGEAALKRAQKLVEQYRQSVLKAAVTGELTKDWREKNQRQIESGEALLQRILQARRDTWEQAELDKLQAKGKAPKDESWKSKYPEPQMLDIANLSKLPEGWVWVRMNQIGEVQLGRQRAPQHHEGEYMRPYLRVANVYEDRIDTSDVMQMNFTPQEYETYQLKYKDILLNEGQSLELVGRSAIYKNEVPGACFQNTLVRFRAYEHVLPEFAQLVFKSYLHTGRFQKIATWTTNIAHLGAGRFAELEFPLPSLQEQELIVEEVERIQSFISAVKESIQSNIRKNIALKQTILKSAFSGQLVSQDPNDEPASELLKRIAQEREAAIQNGTKPKNRNAKK